jgi:hypothetical protein
MRRAITRNMSDGSQQLYNEINMLEIPSRGLALEITVLF